MGALQHPLLLPPDLCRQVVPRPASWQQAALLALRLEAATVKGQVADSGGWPDVVHRPYHPFPTGQYLADVLEREHALVDPVQVDDIRLLELTQSGDICPAIGDIHVEEVLAAQVEAQPDTKTFPEEMPLLSDGGAEGDHRQLVALLVAYQHLRLDPVVVQ